MITSSIQAATNYIYHPLHQKFVEISQTADWKEKTMLAGLIVSVCCAVITFFTQTVFVCSAFAMLSGVCSLGTLYIRHYENLKKMREYISEMKEHISELKTENETFQGSNKLLEKSVTEQTNSVTHLTFENEKLKTEVSKLSIHRDHLKQTSQELIDSVESLRVHLVALNPMVAGTQETERKLSSFSITMEKQQTVAKHLMEVISEASAERSNQLESEKEILRRLEALQRSDTTLKRIEELTLLREQISGSHDKLADVLKNYSDFQIEVARASTELSGLQAQYSLENTRLQETRKELSEVSSGLRSLLAEQRGDTSALKLQIDRLRSLCVGLNSHNATGTNGLD